VIGRILKRWLPITESTVHADIRRLLNDWLERKAGEGFVGMADEFDPLPFVVLDDEMVEVVVQRRTA
jgi:hypothetical protein